MEYIVTYKDDEGKLYIKDRIFMGLLAAEIYADTISPSRDPKITQYLNMYPGGDGKFTCDDFAKMAEMLSELRLLFLFSSDDAGSAPMAAHLVAQAYNHMDNAVQSLHMAALTQARETVR